MKKTYLYAGISILFWSTLATVSKLLLGTLSSYQVLMYSALFAALTLLAVNVINGKIKQLRHYRAKDYLLTLLICLPGTFLYYVFLYLGTAKMAASQAFIINYLWPIMSVLFACIILKERLTARKCIAFALSFLGVLTVAGGELFHFNAETLIGTGLCVLAAVSYGLFTALNQKWSYDEQLSTMLAFFATFLLSMLINALTGTAADIGVPHLLGFAWNGIFVMAIATVTWALALKAGGTAKISNLAYITPFLSLVWTFFILHEPIEPLSLIGLAIIVLGIFIQLKGKAGDA
ncbi:MAG: DMT family transporter [Clostridia bacterium]|nr:DMT family transporter [Clostridia bacterium]